MSSRRKLLLAALAVAVALALSPLLGGEGIVWSELTQPGSTSRRILFELRVPRVLLAAVAGATLAVLGGSYQVLFHNPLAEPYVLGISSAVALGAGVAELLWGLAPGSAAATACGLVGAAVATLALLVMAKRAADGTNTALLLFGMGLNFVLSSLLFLILSYAHQQMGGGGLRWFFGNVPWVSLTESLRFGLVASCLVAVILLFARHLDALSLGDGVARTLGIAPQRSRAWLLALTSACLAWVVVHTGSVGFVGLVVPHAVRRLCRPPSTRALLAWSWAGGAAFLTVADAISRSILPPFEFPIGIVTTLLGGPLFLALLWRRR